ncbi:protocadherin gamma-a10 [Plakobranchus ocellatus]|uniref:Protocadherin gamma-a10 n=1 Tax=Plakobranchus ocellatus TaxID=259542 RepID=A0AAV3Z6D9_9GAST|nr:protocadherin gamma-a10 [Plakobranchus ocellatus]
MYHWSQSFPRQRSCLRLGISLALPLLLVLNLPGVLALDMSYTIDEEIVNGTVIGDIGRDSNVSRLLSQDDFRSLRYDILSYPDDDAALFAIDRVTGKFRTRARIDRELLCRYVVRCKLSLHVSARTASGQQFYTFPITILVEDINDNSPTFSSDSVSVTLDEDVAVLSSIPIPDAVDEDIKENALQRYTLAVPSDKFGLKVTRNLDDSLVPQLYVKSALNREDQPFYQLTVVALDGGTPQLSGELQVNITLRDVNDNPPRFLQSRYEVNVTETTPVNSRILKLEAEDADLGINGRLR